MFKDKEPKIYIQTDKAIYKPGDLVQFRIVVLDENTRPVKLRKPMRLGFKDAAGNFIKQINDIKLIKGVYTGKFQLSEEPVLGVWSMEAFLGPNDDDTREEKKFEVDKYVLPKFSVDIETAKDIYYKDPVKVMVRSKYTYGKPVKGQATITVTSQFGQVKAEKTIDVDGKGYAEFQLEDDIELPVPVLERRFIYNPRMYRPSVTIFVDMTEEYTGNKQNKTTTVNLHHSRYNIKVPEHVYEFVVNKTFQIKAFVKNIDGSPVQNGKQIAKLLISKNYNSEVRPVTRKESEFTSALDKNGMAVFEITLGETGYYSQVRVTYDDQTIYLPSMLGKELQTKEDKSKEEDVGPLKLVMLTEK